MTIGPLYTEFLQSEGICTDSRSDVRGKLFFALKGDSFDGNDYVEEALEKGCRLAVTERRELEGQPGILVTSSALELLQDLARHHRQRCDPQLLAITGSNGKTTTKELVAAILSRRYSVLATEGNLNNHIGVPLTLLRLKSEQVAVIEMGANHPGEIALLSRIAEPDLGLITNVGRAHLEGFGSVEGVLDAKGELYAYLAGSGGKVLVDGTDTLLMARSEESGAASMVIGAEGEIPLTARITGQDPWLEAELELGGVTCRVTSRLVGPYNLQNILLAAGVGIHFGISLDVICEAIGSYAPRNHRSQYLQGKRNQVVLDSYNANPTSMRLAIEGLLSYSHSPRMLILGDMAELGEGAGEAHEELVRWIETLPVERILLVGDYFSGLAEPSDRIGVFKDVEGLESFLEETGPAGYQVLVKGSRIMGLERITGLL